MYYCRLWINLVLSTFPCFKCWQWWWCQPWISRGAGRPVVTTTYAGIHGFARWEFTPAMDYQAWSDQIRIHLFTLKPWQRAVIQRTLLHWRGLVTVYLYKLDSDISRNMHTTFDNKCVCMNTWKETGGSSPMAETSILCRTSFDWNLALLSSQDWFFGTSPLMWCATKATLLLL